MGRSLALVIGHPELMTRSFIMVMSHPALATAVREIENKSIATIPGLLPAVPIPLPADRVKMGSEVAASAAACHVGAVIYDRVLQKNKEKAPRPDKETVSESFLQEIAEIKKEAKSLHSQ